MKKEICEYFANHHCCSNDCPNIRYEQFAERYDEGVAEDAGYSRTSCSKCLYSRNPSCDDCLFQGSEDCPKHKKEGD